VLEGVDAATAWALFEQKARAKDIEPALFGERLLQREPEYKKRWDDELTDLDPGFAPFTEVTDNCVASFATTCDSGPLRRLRRLRPRTTCRARLAVAA
jgi:hypothetical protein